MKKYIEKFDRQISKFSVTINDTIAVFEKENNELFYNEKLYVAIDGNELIYRYIIKNIKSPDSLLKAGDYDYFLVVNKQEILIILKELIALKDSAEVSGIEIIDSDANDQDTYLYWKNHIPSCKQNYMRDGKIRAYLLLDFDTDRGDYYFDTRTSPSVLKEKYYYI